MRAAAHRSPSRSPARALAPAKLNLYLDVLGRRADGWHDLETLFLALDWGDDVEVEARPSERTSVRLEARGPVPVPAGEENLAWRAARRLLEEAGLAADVLVRLEKRVPVGGGLGGGSSDAATVLRLLADLLGASPEATRRAARALGADVPFFLEGGAAIGRGRGDEIEPLGAPPSLEVVLVVLPQGHETARVFAHAERRLSLAPPSGLAAARDALLSGEPARVREAHFNALAGPAMAAYPGFARLVSDVERRLGRPPCLSGSGSTLFDVPDPGEAADVLRRLEGLPGTRVRARTAGR